MEEKITLKINNKEVTVPAGSTILEAAKAAGVKIPTLCWLRNINESGNCRMCVTEVKGRKRLATACMEKAEEGMEVLTHSAKVLESRKDTLKLLLSNHERKCLSCIRSESCELQALCKEYGVDDDSYYDGERLKFEPDDSAPHMIRDNNKCILCGRCVAMCRKVQGIGVIGKNDRGFDTYVGSAFDMGLGNTSCIQCGQCIAVCPTGALYEKDDTQRVFDAIDDPDKFVVVQTAPSVRAALGECFGLPVGTNTEGKMVTALRQLGFDEVFDTQFGADLTILEEANELIERIENGGTLPMITSCSPGWINYCEHYYPDLLDHISTCKSPHEMFGAIVKTYYAEKIGKDPEDIVVVSIMPCTAKKGEILRADEDAAGVPDVDISLTTRELGRMIRRKGINFMELENSEFDNPLGLSTGAAVIFGASGGVMEAALRTAVEKLTGEELQKLEFTDVRGMKGLKEASYEVAGTTIKVAIASGTGNAKVLLDKIRSGEADYQFIEIMGCPGGCINGGGQPQVHADVRNFTDYRSKRASVLYQIDDSQKLRKSHENPAIIRLYEEFLEEPGSEIAHRLLHTSYQKQEMYI